MSSAQSPLLWVPPRTTTDVSFAGSLRSTIAHVYQEGPDGYKEEIANLDRCRQDALRGSAGSDNTGRDLLYKYFGQLELLELRFPEVRVPFPWKDAFTGKEISQLSLAYEKASVIFNIGSTLSSLAAQQNRSSPEGLKRAFHNARCAAGMFSYINDNFLHAPSTDLSREVVKTLVTLMVAQATEIFVERLTEEKKGAGLRARVSTQAASLYGGVIEDVREQVQKGIFDRSWTWYVQAKHKYLASLAQYQRSLADASSSKHGEALARLHVAEAAAKEASRFAGSCAAAQQGMHSMTMLGTALTTHPTLATLPSDAGLALIDITKSHLSLCSEARIAAHKENDLIYHDAQPSEASLPAIERASVADPIPIQDVYGAPEVQKVVGPDIFVRLVPLSVHESASLYSEEKAKLVRTEGERCDVADSELAAALDHMGLPAALDKFRDVAGVQTGGPAGASGSRLEAMAEPPGQVRQWADEVRSAAPPLESLSKDIDEARAHCAREIDATAGELDAEHRACEQMRVRYGHLWEQSPSSGLTKGWRSELRNQREALEQAKASDRSVGDLWNDVRSDVAILADPHGEAVERLFAVAVAGGGGSGTNGAQNLLDVDDVGTADEAEAGTMKVHIRAIEEGLGRLQGLKKERQGVFRDLKERIQTDDISQLLILNRKSSNIEPALFAAELEKFRAHSGRLAAAVHHQGVTLQDVEEHYNALASGKQAKEVQERWRRATAKRKELVERLRRAKEGHDDVRAGLSKGVLFYRELEDAVGSVKQQVASFIKQRATERQDLASRADVRQRLEGRGGSDPALAPTPAPTTAQTLEQQVRSMDLGSSTRSPAPLPPPRPPPVQTRTTSSTWQPPPSQSPTTPLSASTGPAYQSFPPPPTPQQYQAYPQQSAPPPPPVSSPPADPYAGLGSFGSHTFSPAPTPYQPQQPQSPASYAPRTSLPPPPPPVSASYQSPPPGRVPSGTYSAQPPQPPPPPPPSVPYPHHSTAYRPTPPPPPPPQSAPPSWQAPPQQQHPGYASGPGAGQRYGGPLPPPPPPSQTPQYGGPPQSPYGYGYQPQVPARQASGPPPPQPPPPPQGQQPYYHPQPPHQQQQGYYR